MIALAAAHPITDVGGPTARCSASSPRLWRAGDRIRVVALTLSPADEFACRPGASGTVSGDGACAAEWFGGLTRRYG